jgi:endonuclease/exonuclease/phosphatase (EEP) superfamily protein YafD
MKNRPAIKRRNRRLPTIARRRGRLIVFNTFLVENTALARPIDYTHHDELPAKEITASVDDEYYQTPTYREPQGRVNREPVYA